MLWPVLFLVNFLATMRYWSLYYAMDDEAITVLGAQRLLAGEWPYYHWDTRHTPGSYLLSVLYFAWLGTDQLAVRSLMSLLASASGLVIFALGRRTLPGGWAFLPWLLWCGSGLLNFPILNHHWFGTLGSLLGLYQAVRWQQGLRRAPELLGAAAALAAWCLQADGLAVTLMIAFTWLRYRPPGLPRVVLAGFLTSLVLWLPFLPCLGEVWRENFLAMREHIGYNRYPYSWRSWLGLGQACLLPDLPWQARWPILSLFFTQTLVHGLFYGLVIAAPVILEWRRQPRLAVLAWCLLGWALALGNRQTPVYLSFACGGVFLVLAALLRQLPRAAFWGVGLGALQGLSYLGCWYGTARDYQLPILTRAGVYYTNARPTAEAMAQLRRWSDQFFPPGSRVLAYPYMSSFYTTEKLRNPLRQPVLTPFLYSRAEVERTARELERPEFILYVPLSPQFMESNYFIPAATYARVAEEELKLLTEGYELFQEAGSLKLFRRKS